MTPAIHLTQSETKKIGDKKSVAYELLKTALKKLKGLTGMDFSVIGTDAKGNLYVVNLG